MDVDPSALVELCVRAGRTAGASPDMARHLAEATVAAERRGHPEVGVAHFMDYLSALRRGTIDGRAEPTVTSCGVTVTVDADRGIAQSAFAHGFRTLRSVLDEHGVGILRLSNSFTTGELGHYTNVVAEHGFIALAVANSPALVAPEGTAGAVLGTNPMSFAVPAAPRPLLADQGISEAAYVTVRRYAAEGRPLPDGWAVDRGGEPTNDASQALAGALRPAAGHKMVNIGLIAEILAGLAGARWSTEADDFSSGADSPAVGLFLLALSPGLAGPGFLSRLQSHLSSLEEDHGMRLPGRRRELLDSVRLDDDVNRALTEAC